MLGGVARRAPLIAPRAPARVPRRFMSGDGTPEELADTSDLWFKLGLGGLGAVVIPFSFYMVYVESQHEHHHKANYPHIRIRHKPFPWAAKDCDLMDFACKRGESHGDAHAAHH